MVETKGNSFVVTEIAIWENNLMQKHHCYWNATKLSQSSDPRWFGSWWKLRFIDSFRHLLWCTCVRAPERVRLCFCPSIRIAIYVHLLDVSLRTKWIHKHMYINTRSSSSNSYKNNHQIIRLELKKAKNKMKEVIIRWTFYIHRI